MRAVVLSFIIRVLNPVEVRLGDSFVVVVFGASRNTEQGFERLREVLEQERVPDGEPEELFDVVGGGHHENTHEQFRQLDDGSSRNGTGSRTAPEGNADGSWQPSERRDTVGELLGEHPNRSADIRKVTREVVHIREYVVDGVVCVDGIGEVGVRNTDITNGSIRTRKVGSCRGNFPGEGVEPADVDERLSTELAPFGVSEEAVVCNLGVVEVGEGNISLIHGLRFETHGRVLKTIDNGIRGMFAEEGVDDLRHVFAMAAMEEDGVEGVARVHEVGCSLNASKAERVHWKIGGRSHDHAVDSEVLELAELSEETPKFTIGAVSSRGMNPDNRTFAVDGLEVDNLRVRCLYVISCSCHFITRT